MREQLDSVCLFHVSEDDDLKVLHPRPYETAPDAGPIVWAIDDLRLPNYLLPRDCPRVTFAAGPMTSAEDRVRFAAGEGRIVVIEAAWLQRVCSCRLHLYEVPVESFQLFDQIAGYWVSTGSVVPTQVTTVTDVATAITERGGELRVVHRLWPLHHAIANSTLAFSMIRMRNALK